MAVSPGHISRCGLDRRSHRDEPSYSENNTSLLAPVQRHPSGSTTRCSARRRLLSGVNEAATALRWWPRMRLNGRRLTRPVDRDARRRRRRRIKAMGSSVWQHAAAQTHTARHTAAGTWHSLQAIGNFLTPLAQLVSYDCGNEFGERLGGRKNIVLAPNAWC